MTSLVNSNLGKLVLRMAQKGKIKAFIETGTYLDSTMLWASRYFDQVFGIVRSESDYEQAEINLGKVSNITLITGKFAERMAEINKLVDTPALLLMDAQEIYSVTACEQNEWTILNELKSLEGRHGDILIINNTHLLFNRHSNMHEGGNGSLLTRIVDALRLIDPCYYILFFENTIVAAPVSLRNLLEGELLSEGSEANNGIEVNIQELVARLALRSSQLPIEQIHDFNQLSRNQWVKAKAIEVTPGSKVLDVGAGTCLYRSLFSHCEYVSHDFQGYDGYRENKEGQYGQIDIKSDITSIPVNNNSFDVILCTEVLEHVPEPILALKEMVRIVKPGGRLLITAPLGSGLHQLPYHYYGGFSPEWYRKFLGDFGCQIVSIIPNGGFYKLLAQECARMAWTMDEHKEFHGADSDLVGHIFGDLLPRYLFAMDEAVFSEHFTVGYFVEAEKILCS